MITPVSTHFQHRHSERDEWHTVDSDDARSSDPALELARWLDVPDAVDEPGDWRCLVRLSDGTEVVGEEIAVEIGERQ